MKLLAPKYYKNFKCIADKCSHSCCIGWEIDIDHYTLEKYNLLDGKYSAEIRDSIEYKDVPHFRLCGDERCPHLDENGLCRIISSLGEGYLCDICKEHPRFYNDTLFGKEVGLGMACEEACRIILNSNDYDCLVEIEDLDIDTEEIYYNPIFTRNYIFSILKNPYLSYKEKLNRIYDEFAVSPACLDDSRWHEIISNLEYLAEDHKELFLSYSSSTDTDYRLEVYFERALAYFIYRHCTQAYDDEDFRAMLGFCLFCERLLSSCARDGADIYLCARIISEELEYSTDNTEEIKSQFYC